MTSSAEVIAVGTELLLGEITNGNGQFFAQELAQLGIAHHFQSIVGDNPQRIHQVLEVACARSNLLLFTGGLGPTPDDLTTAAIATFFQTPLVEHPDVLTDIVAKHARRGRPMPPSNAKQALLPAGAEVLPNPVGTAPGMIWSPRPGLLILTFPGVPAEMKAMWQATAVPYLKAQGWAQGVIHSQVLRFWGVLEAALAETLATEMALENPTVAPYAGRGEVRLRITAQAETLAAAQALIDPVVQRIRATAGRDCYGSDDETLASVVGDLLQARGETLAVAESCTGGGLGTMLTEVPGSSAYFLGGIVAYANALKTNLLGVSPQTLAEFGAVSGPVAEAMAAGIRETVKSTWALAITGIAGPAGGTPDKPVGLVYVGIAGPGVLEHQILRLAGERGRTWIREVSACSALDHLRRHLLSSASRVA